MSYLVVGGHHDGERHFSKRPEVRIPERTELDFKAGPLSSDDPATRTHDYIKQEFHFRNTREPDITFIILVAFSQDIDETFQKLIDGYKP